jgi:hypothetical protein
VGVGVGVWGFVGVGGGVTHQEGFQRVICVGYMHHMDYMVLLSASCGQPCCGQHASECTSHPPHTTLMLLLTANFLETALAQARPHTIVNASLGCSCNNKPAGTLGSKGMQQPQTTHPVSRVQPLPSPQQQLPGAGTSSLEW